MLVRKKTKITGLIRRKEKALRKYEVKERAHLKPVDGPIVLKPRFRSNLYGSECNF